MLIVFKAKNIGFYVKLNESAAAREVVQRLPLEGEVRKWGDEIYFETGISAPAGGETLDVQVGDVAYWPPGKCLCVFFGRTEASIADKPVPEGPVVVIGHTMAAPGELREINAGELIRVFVMGKAWDYALNRNPYEDNRKLSQQEIDILVKKLLEEKGNIRQ